MVAAAKPATKQSVTFRVAPGARLSKDDAQVIGRELVRIRASGEQLTKEAVLAAAESRRSPLHRYFEWSDRRAAHQYRLTQASYLLRSIEVVVEDNKGSETAIKAFFNVSDADGRRWEPMQFVFEDDGLAKRVIDDAYSQLEGWIARYKRYEWAAQAVPIATRALRSIKKKSPKVGR